MTLSPASRSPVRVAVVAALAITGVVLFLLGQCSVETPAEREEEIKGDLRSVNAVVDTVLARHGIGKPQVRSWQVQTPDRKFIRIERRVTVHPEFVAVQFNHDLNEELSGTGTRVVATERTKENTVTMHIKQGPTIIESITFVVSRERDTSSGREVRRPSRRRR